MPAHSATNATHSTAEDTTVTPTGSEQILAQADNLYKQLADMKIMTDAEYSALKTQLGGTAGEHGNIEWTDETAQKLLDALKIKLLAAQDHPALDPITKLIVECDDIFKQINAITPFAEADYYALGDTVRGGADVPWTLATATDLRDQMQIKLSVAQNNQGKPYTPTNTATHTAPDGYTPGTKIVEVVATTPTKYVMPDDIKQLIMKSDDLFKQINTAISISDVKIPFTEDQYYAYGDSVRGGAGVPWTLVTATNLVNGMQEKLDKFNQNNLDFTQEGDNAVVTVAGSKYKVPMMIVGAGIVAVVIWLVTREKTTIIHHK